MAVPAEITPAKRAYRRREVHELYGASFSAIDRAIREGHVKAKRQQSPPILISVPWL